MKLKANILGIFKKEKKEISTGDSAIVAEELLKLVKSSASFGIAINANDFFGYACTDMLIIDGQDLKWVMPMYQKYGYAGIDACMAYIAKEMPIKPRITAVFKKAYREIKRINPEVYSEY